GILNGGASAQTEMVFCTIYGNTSNEGGGGIWNGVTNSASQLVMRNSLVVGNKAPAGPEILGKLTSQGYNLIQNTQDITFAPSQLHGTDLLQVASSALGIDPLLKDNNGSTQTHALLPGSTVCDFAALSLTTAVGFSRIMSVLAPPAGTIGNTYSHLSTQTSTT